MKIKFWLSALVGMAAWSLSSVATAGWLPGPCPANYVGPPPCIEIVVNGNTYHFNGDGGQAERWKGIPDAEGGGDIEFEGDNVALGCSLAQLNCTLQLTGQVKKCQDSNGNWRIGVRVTGGEASDGLFCGTVDMYNFPWYSKNPAIANHCPFEDDCDSFIPYDANASSYTGNFGAISVDALGLNLVDEEHLHGVVFTPGLNATFDFSDKTFYDCNEGDGCGIDGILELKNAEAVYIY